MLGGVSYGELGFTAILVVIVLLAQLAPRLGEAVGARFDKGGPEDPEPKA